MYLLHHINLFPMGVIPQLVLDYRYSAENEVFNTNTSFRMVCYYQGTRIKVSKPSHSCGGLLPGYADQDGLVFAFVSYNISLFYPYTNLSKLFNIYSTFIHLLVECMVCLCLYQLIVKRSWTFYTWEMVTLPLIVLLHAVPYFVLVSVNKDKNI